MRTAIRIANDNDAELVLLHAWSPLPPPVFVGEYVHPPHLVQELVDAARHGVEDALGEAKQLGAKQVIGKLATGIAWAEIVHLLEQEPFDLVVMSTHGRTGISRVLLGSIAEKVIRHAPCSVLAVRPDTPDKPFEHVLCPVDFSNSSRLATRLATQLLRPDSRGITLMHVIEAPVAAAGRADATLARALDKQGTAQLEAWAAELRPLVPAPVVARTRIGYAGAETIAAIDDDPTIDLVVMGTHGRTGIKRVLLGSVAEKVVRHARCPVLIARDRH